MFAIIKRANITRFIKACKEINIAFIPYEEQVTTRLLLRWWCDGDGTDDSLIG